MFSLAYLAGDEEDGGELAAGQFASLGSGTGTGPAAQQESLHVQTANLMSRAMSENPESTQGVGTRPLMELFKVVSGACKQVLP